MQLRTTDTVLITGASSGIGRELARVLAHRVGRLVLVARRADRLNQLSDELCSRCSGLAVTPEVRDLTDPVEVQTLIDTLGARRLTVDVLVNNAGIGDYGLFENLSWHRIEAILQLNIMALVQLTHAFVPGMLARGRGGVLNIGSGAGSAAMPNAAVYTGTKHFVRAFTESLRAQLQGTGVSITEAEPGPVWTEFGEVNEVAERHRRGNVIKIPARQCAREIAEGFLRGDAVVIPGAANRVLMGVTSIAPRAAIRQMLIKEAQILRADANQDRQAQSSSIGS
jgi:short-subunit dehydrogenase